MKHRSLLNDQLFKFIVRPGRKKINVQADVFARLSRPLNAIVNGNFTEGKDECTTWEQVDENTFDGLRQFAYCGDSVHHMYNDKKKNERVSIIRIRENDYYVEETRSDGRIEVDVFDDEPCENLLELMMHHAQLHVLAYKYCIEELVRITTAKLGKLLHNLIITQESVKDIVYLIQYIFEHTLPQDPARELLTYFGAIIIHDIYNDEDFVETALSVPDFLLAVFKKVTMYRVNKG
ncbi:hypothetical protein F4804DRAFT_354224 [Jackrogersella minutella]|nr:hypothetical protein F4804DRAFT_354224 [Jackrogersella minutella]